MSAAVNKPMGVEFSVIKVVCIAFFRTIRKPINTINLPKRVLTADKYLFTAHDIGRRP